MHTWVIDEINRRRCSSQVLIDSVYDGFLKEEGSRGCCSFTVKFSEAELLMKHFGVGQISELVGKSFVNEKAFSDSALNLLLVQIQHNGNYTPPSHESLLQRAAEAMAKMKEPDFSDVDKETVYDAFQKEWGYGSQADSKWLVNFANKIYKLSRCEVMLVKAISHDGFPNVLGPAEYLFLIKGYLRQRVVIGPYSTPVEFY